MKDHNIKPNQIYKLKNTSIDNMEYVVVKFIPINILNDCKNDMVVFQNIRNESDKLYYMTVDKFLYNYSILSNFFMSNNTDMKF